MKKYQQSSSIIYAKNFDLNFNYRGEEIGNKSCSFAGNFAKIRNCQRHLMFGTARIELVN